MTKFETIYKLDNAGRIREFRMEADGARTRTITGIQSGAQVVSGWKDTKAKNVGRSNGTTAEEQAIVEIENKYALKLAGDYHETLASAKKGKPQRIKPMLASEWENRKDKIDYPVFVQPKLDGIRCIATATGLWSRTGKPIVAVPHINKALDKFFKNNPDAILDGELYNHDFKDDFNAIISMVRKTKPSDEALELAEQKVQYHVYDLASHDGNFDTRIGRVDTIVRNVNNPAIVCVETWGANDEDQVDKLYGNFIEQGYEGGIVRLDLPYEFKRSKTLMKRKDFEDKEFKIVDILPGKGNWAGYAKRVVFELEDGRTCGSGLAATQELAKEILDNKEDYIGKQVTVQYFTRTPDGVPRFPIAKALHKKARW
jgi:DNA ligase 1